MYPVSPMLIDSHCHLTASAYAEDRDDVLERAVDAGVGTVITIASDPEDAVDALALTRIDRARGPRIYSTSGIHPHQVGDLPDSVEALDPVRALLDEPEVVAVGECGLDFHYDFATPDAQFRWFQAQLELAAEVDLPVVVHCREAEEAMIPRVREAGEAGVRGVLHCYPGDLALLEVALDAGWSVSFTGIVTFRSFDGVEAVRTVPGDRYFVETDGPYLAPVPHRGKRNEPAYVSLVADRVAELRGESPEVVARDSTRNAHAFFRLP